jgi:hypothetical protein
VSCWPRCAQPTSFCRREKIPGCSDKHRISLILRTKEDTRYEFIRATLERRQIRGREEDCDDDDNDDDDEEEEEEEEQEEEEEEEEQEANPKLLRPSHFLPVNTRS